MKKSDKIIKSALVSVVFLGMLFGFGVANILHDPPALIESERRTPKEFPKLSYEAFMDASFMEKLEEYLMDNFPLREEFRKVKGIAILNLFGQKDNNSVYKVGDFLSQYEKNFKKEDVAVVGKKFEILNSKYLNGLNVYLSVIPDKNYFMAEENGYPHYSYEELVQILLENTPNLNYIDIMDTVKLEQFYKTDLHWDQSKISPVIDKLAEKIGFTRNDTNFVYNEKDGFYGNFAGQIAHPVPSEKLTYLTSETLDAAKVYIMNETTGEFEEAVLYEDADFEHPDPYDFFLNGPTALIKIVNERATTDKRLILFRDSFGSSATPLLVDGYSEIYVIDLRYTRDTLLPQKIEFREGDDALFLFSTSMITKLAGNASFIMINK